MTTRGLVTMIDSFLIALHWSTLVFALLAAFALLALVVLVLDYVVGAVYRACLHLSSRRRASAVRR